MRHTCDLGTDAIRVFLSSSMHDRPSLDLRRALKTFLDRFEMIDCRIIEKTSDGNPVRAAYTDQVLRADLMLLVLEGDRREGVVDEFRYARSLGKEILGFHRLEGASDELKDFLHQEVFAVDDAQDGITCAPFTSHGELLDLIEESLLGQMSQGYKHVLQERKARRRETMGLGTTPGMIGGGLRSGGLGGGS